MRPRWSGVAPGRDHGVCNLHQGASGAIGHARVARPNGTSDEEPAGASGARFFPIFNSRVCVTVHTVTIITMRSG